MILPVKNPPVFSITYTNLLSVLFTECTKELFFPFVPFYDTPRTSVPSRVNHPFSAPPPTGRQADRPEGRQADRPTGQQADRPTGRQADVMILPVKNPPVFSITYTNLLSVLFTECTKELFFSFVPFYDTPRTSVQSRVNHPFSAPPPTGRQADRLTGRKADRRTGRHADRPAGRQADVMILPVKNPPIFSITRRANWPTGQQADRPML